MIKIECIEGKDTIYQWKRAPFTAFLGHLFTCDDLF